MIRTSIVTGPNDPWLDGFAKDVNTAIWIFLLCGWEKDGEEYPSLMYQIDEIGWEDSTSQEYTEFYVLGYPIQLN